MSANIVKITTDLPPNPNTYDEEAFMQASNTFQGNVTDAIQDLWDAGARIGDIESEFANALDSIIA